MAQVVQEQHKVIFFFKENGQIINMSFFSRKKKAPQAPAYSAGQLDPRRINISSREYRLYRSKSETRLNWYEQLAKFAVGIINVSFDKKTTDDINAAIDFTGLRIKPNAPTSLFLLSIILFSFLGGFLFALRIIPTAYGMIASVILGLAVGYFLMMYPKSHMKTLRIQASSQVVLAILYMVVSMRISPNVERALRFTSSNISGMLAWDMRRLLWDIEMGKYYSANEALANYIVKWKPENEEFSEALRMIVDSQSQIQEKAEKTLDEALRVVLEGTRDRMKHYAQDLQMPVTMIHMMGIVLPILGSVMAPMAAIFLSDMITPWHFLAGYDILLPILLVWFINNTLSKRPVTFSKIDVSQHPSLPPPGSFMIRSGKKKIIIPAFPIALLVGALILIMPVLYFAENSQYLIVPMVDDGSGNMVPSEIQDPAPDTTLLMSILITVGAGASLSIYFLLSNLQRSRVEATVYKMESEFELALFQLGNRISGGTPLEIAVEKAAVDVKDMEISNLFQIVLRNMRNFGMTFENALMNPQSGALRFYPSRLIQNVMRTITDTARKGVQFASESMLTVSKYLKSVRETQEYMRTLLSETTSSMQFQAYGMAPLVSGLIVAMSSVIIQIIGFLGTRLNEFGLQDSFGIDPSSILGSSSAVTPAMFQLIMGTYLIEVIIILAMFVTKVNRGDDKSSQWLLAGKMIFIAVIIYSMVAIGSSMMFGSMIEDAMRTLA